MYYKLFSTMFVEFNVINNTVTLIDLREWNPHEFKTFASVESND